MWFPEIAFKGDKLLKSINPSDFGFTKKRQYLFHIHGLVEQQHYDELRRKFPAKNQVKVKQVGAGKYQSFSFDQNISNIVKYSTKRNFKTKTDIAIIEANPNGFGHFTID